MSIVTTIDRLTGTTLSRRAPRRVRRPRGHHRVGRRPGMRPMAELLDPSYGASPTIIARIMCGWLRW